MKPVNDEYPANEDCGGDIKINHIYEALGGVLCEASCGRCLEKPPRTVA
jgi:hypothetical protein